MSGTEPEVLVLCYHAVSEDWPASLAVTPDALERQLLGFQRQGFRGATFDEAVTRPHAQGMALVVTFDDAYRSVVERAFPILERLGIPATVFAPTAGPDGGPRSWPGVDRWIGTAWEPELAGATWAQLRDLVDAGWEIGSHTRSHPHLTELDDAALTEELERSRTECERLVGVTCRTLAYPYGDVDHRVAEAAGRAGYVAGAGLSGPLPGARRQDIMRWPRLGVYREDRPTRLRVKAHLYRRHPRAWNLAQAARDRARVARSGKGSAT